MVIITDKKSKVVSGFELASFNMTQSRDQPSTDGGKSTELTVHVSNVTIQSLGLQCGSRSSWVGRRTSQIRFLLQLNVLILRRGDL